jgi:hypothetical protein
LIDNDVGLKERSPEKPDVGFGSSYLNAFSPQDLGKDVNE